MNTKFTTSRMGRPHRILARLLFGSYTFFISPVRWLTTTRLKSAASFGFLQPQQQHRGSQEQN